MGTITIGLGGSGTNITGTQYRYYTDGTYNYRTGVGDVLTKEFDIHYEIDALGSKEEYVK